MAAPVPAGVKALAAFDVSFLHQPYDEEYPEFAGSFPIASTELKKFFSLPMHLAGPLAMMSRRIDKLWHTFIVHTPQYGRFCNDVYGEYLDHQPRSEQFPVGAEAISNFYSGYRKIFGEVPRIWTHDIPHEHVPAVLAGQVPEGVQELKWSGWPGW